MGLTFTDATREDWLDHLRTWLKACDPTTSSIVEHLGSRESPDDPDVQIADLKAGVTIVITLNGGA